MARILAVDESERLLRRIQVELTAPDFEVVTARSAATALEHLSRGPCDLILVGVDLAGEDGFELYRRLAANEQSRSVPVIFLFGVGEGRARIPDGGAVDYLAKPIEDHGALRACVSKRLRARLDQQRDRQQRLDTAQRLQEAERTLLAAHETVRDLEALAAPGDDEVRAIALFDGDFRLIESNETFRSLLEPVAERREPVGRALVGALRSRMQGNAAHFELPLGESIYDVQADWVRPGGLLCVRMFDASDCLAVRKRIERRRPAALPDAARRDETSYRIPGFVGSSPRLTPVIAAVDLLRNKRVTVLVQGESGTGKELVSRALHFGGADAHQPFIPIHCGAISPELIESELFGYVKGAFTGATGNKRGLFSAADGGTIFLDEIAETSTDLQVKLLRVLQHREIRPVGATHPIHVDVRIVAATNKNLEDMVRRDLFREDLYYRLEVVTIDVPALRDWVESVPELVEHFIGVFNERLRTQPPRVVGVSQGALQKLCAYSWPGNVRELEHVIERAFALSSGDTILEEHLPPKVVTGEPALRRRGVEGASGRLGAMRDLKAATEDSQRQLIWQALEQNSWDMSKTAAALNMPRSTFYRKCSRFGIRRPGRPGAESPFEA